MLPLGSPEPSCIAEARRTTVIINNERWAEVRPEVADQRGDLDAVGALGLVAEVGLVAHGEPLLHHDAALT